MDKPFILPNGLNENLSYLISILNHNSIRILNTGHEIKNLRNSVEVIIICDTGNSKLILFFSILQEEFFQRSVPIIEIDHHLEQTASSWLKDEKTGREVSGTYTLEKNERWSLW